MRILNCLAFDHDWRLVLLALFMCILGSWVSMTLIRRALTEQGGARLHWIFLSAVTAGAATWATHFIAMLGYQTQVPVSFDVTLTIVSALIAIVGMALGIAISGLSRSDAASLAGGGIIGLSISAMHYTGMFAYRAEGVVSWEPAYVVGSIALSAFLGMAAMASLRRGDARRVPLVPIVLLVAAIVTLHFTGMAGFALTPVPGVEAAANAGVMSGMAAAVALVALLVVGTGVSTHLLERRTFSQSQDELEHIAMHDALTGLANRHSFSAELAADCQRLADDGTPFSLVMIDLDRFKPINDSLGHPAGDEVLQKVAVRLRRAAREGDTVARLGGDEFAIIARGIRGRDQAEALAGRVVEILLRPFIVRGNVAEIGGSVGIALAPQHGRTVAALVQHADVALYSAKRSGREKWCLFLPEMMEKVKSRRLLETDLRRACMREDFEVHYQPVYDTRSRAIIGAEALLRWTCEERGEVPPSVFVPIAEDLGLISRLGAWVLRQACLDAAGWGDDLDIAVNISPVQLLDPRLPQMVARALEEAGLPASRLELEITETALLGNDEVAFRTLTRLRELGVRISLDDFGTGYSSLSYLHRFPINRIKIDKSFVKLLPDDPGSVSIVRAIAQLGESLGLQITAEGIESEAQFEFIERHGCGQVQGFLISRPVGITEFRRMIGATDRLQAAS